ncbi:MAG: AF1514 family protein [Desulfobulbus sp.]|nr:AF1514 family protein [Desulfobulbus sp.]
MRKIAMEIQREFLDFSLARSLGDCLAARENEEFTLICWFDSLRKIHSPQCLHCEIKGEQGWEVYGRNHGGRLRISFNQETIVLIYS